MVALDTQMGGSKEGFPTTCWSIVLSCTNEEEERKKQALTRLVEAYWRPVYRFIRYRGKRVEEAKDLTQSFLIHVVESDLIDRYQKEKGRFRGFLKGAVKFFLSRDREKQGALKRGGGLQILPLDIEKLESDLAGTHPAGGPEEAFDRQWREDLLTRSLEEVRDQLDSEGKGNHFSIYETYEFRPREGRAVTYQDLAERFDLTADQVKHHLVEVRERMARQVRRNVAEGVASATELADEMAELFST